MKACLLTVLMMSSLAACANTTGKPVGNCQVDADCVAYSDYCEGCKCTALSQQDAQPICTGTTVNCFVDPCFNQQAVCRNNQCVTTTRNPDTSNAAK